MGKMSPDCQLPGPGVLCTDHKHLFGQGFLSAAAQLGTLLGDPEAVPMGLGGTGCLGAQCFEAKGTPTSPWYILSPHTRAVTWATRACFMWSCWQAAPVAVLQASATPGLAWGGGRVPRQQPPGGCCRQYDASHPFLAMELGAADLSREALVFSSSKWGEHEFLPRAARG